MHELSLAMSVMKQVELCLADFGPEARAVRITLEVGRLRAVVPDAMRFCFRAVSEGTGADSAELVIEEIPVRVRCESCGTEWAVQEVAFFCPDCGSSVKTLTGKELLLRTIEVEE